jgi:hypothetical protein
MHEEQLNIMRQLMQVVQSRAQRIMALEERVSSRPSSAITSMSDTGITIISRNIWFVLCTAPYCLYIPEDSPGLCFFAEAPFHGQPSPASSVADVPVGKSFLHPTVFGAKSFGTQTHLIFNVLFENRLPAHDIDTLVWAENAVVTTPHASTALVSLK